MNDYLFATSTWYSQGFIFTVVTNYHLKMTECDINLVHLYWKEVIVMYSHITLWREIIIYEYVHIQSTMSLYVE